MATIRSTGRMVKRVLKKREGSDKYFMPPDVREYFVELERKRQLEIANDPQLKQQFMTVTDFLQEWSLRNPEERERIGAQLRERANAIVDMPFKQDLEDLQTSLTDTMKGLNDKYSFFEKGEMTTLQDSIKNLDKSAIRQLTESFRSIEQRGMGDSGLMRKAANAIMNNRTDAVETAQAAANFNKDQALNVLQAGQKTATQAAAINERGIKELRTEEQIKKTDVMVDREVQQNLTAQEQAGALELTIGNVSKYKPSMLNPDTLPTPDSVNTTPGMVGVPSAAQIQSTRLGISGATNTPAPVPFNRTAPVPAAPTSTPSRPTLTESADRRRQIRLARTKSSY